jgi:hypothetical protein
MRGLRITYFRSGVTLALVLAVAAVSASLAQAEKPAECQLVSGCEVFVVTATVPLLRHPTDCGSFSWCARSTYTAPGTYATTFTITNNGHVATGPLTSTFMVGQGYTYIDDTCTGRNLAPGKSCSLTMTFTATDTTASYFGQVIINGRNHKGWNPVARLIIASGPA